MSWDWLKGGADFLTGGLTDFDNKGSSGYNWITRGSQWNPIGGGSDNRWGPEVTPAASTSGGINWGDAFNNFAKGYAATMNSGSRGGGGGSFSSQFKPSGPAASVSMSQSGGVTGSMGDDFLMFKEPNIVLQNYPPETAMAAATSQGGGSAQPAKRSTGDKVGGAIGGAVSGFAACGPICAVGGGLAGFLCDIRFKTDVSPLDSTEVNDELAQVAFFVKELRECS